jgi:CheY-like chemotaxis protein
MTLKSHHIKTVLVVDDESLVRAMLYRILTADGFNVLEAADGIAALEILGGAHRVDLLLTDVMMPRLGGCELVISARKLQPDLAVIMISGAIDLSSPQFQRLAECFEVKDAIAKPFTPAQILGRVRTAIGHASNTVEL